MTIHETAIVSSKAKIGKNVSIGQFTTIYENVVIEDDSIIEGYCELGVSNPLSDGELLTIGPSSHIRSHSIFYEGSTLGRGLITGHRVTVREKTMAGINFQIGTLSDIQGHCSIGDYVRFHSNVHIGQHSKIGNYVWIFPYVVLTNDPHPPSNIMQGVIIEDFVAIATMSVILPGVKVKEGALIGAHSSVNRDVNSNTVVAGSPAKFICETNKIMLKNDSTKSAYPWRKHFHNGYPSDLVNNWVREFSLEEAVL